jgi:hypothetical protein
MKTISTKSKWIATDGWRGYSEPVNAIGGCNHTGSWSDSPCPTDVVKKELNGFKRILKHKGIRFKTFACNTSNVFCQSVYLLVDPENKERGKELATEYSRLDGVRLFYSC